MKTNGNQTSKIYDKLTKSWFEVTNEVFREYTRFCGNLRKRLQGEGKCRCPRSKWWLCDANCSDCEFSISPLSLDTPILTKTGYTDSQLLDLIESPSPSPEKVAVYRDLLAYLFDELRKMNPDAESIINLWKETSGKISDRKLAEAIGCPQRTLADRMKKFREKHRHYLDE